MVATGYPRALPDDRPWSWATGDDGTIQAAAVARVAHATDTADDTEDCGRVNCWACQRTRRVR